MAKTNPGTLLASPGAHAKELATLLRENARAHRLTEVFSDFCELGALSISNAIDKLQFDAREARYLQIVGKYTCDEIERFPKMLAVLVEWLECGFGDRLGELFMSLELGDNFKGQFFTPYELSSLMARMTMLDVRSEIERKGFITVNEPACGAGGMVIACAEAVHEQGINYQQTMHVIAQDIDATAVHMTYLQLSLLHVPAIVVHGNTITLKEWAHWVTPAHVLGGWDWRLRRRAEDLVSASLHEVPKLDVREVPAAAPEVDQVADLRRSVVDTRVAQLQLFG